MRKAYLAKKGPSLSKQQREDAWNMNLAMYGTANEIDSNFNETPLDRESNVKNIVDMIEKEIALTTKKNAVATLDDFSLDGMMVTYTDPITGEIVTIDPGVAKSLAHTRAYAETQLWPGLPQVDQEALFGIPTMLIDVRRMTKGKPGMPAYFAVLAANRKHGTFTFLSSGEVVHKTISKLSGIDVTSGEPNGYKRELPAIVVFKLIERPDGQPYFILEPPMKSAN
jgi:hypothetical protein